MLYLGASVLVAKTNEQRIERIQKEQYPVIEGTLFLKEDVERLREALTNAIILENHFLIEDALELANDFDKRLQSIERRIAVNEPYILEIRSYFDAYKSMAGKLAQNLIEQPENLSLFEESANRTNEAFRLLNSAINGMLSMMQADYSASLDKVTHDINRTNLGAAIIGLIFLVGLSFFTFWINRRVMSALVKADRLKEAFLTSISHELRTPMNGIVGALSLLQQTTSHKHDERLLGIARQSASNMSQTIDDILTFTDLISGEPRLSLTAFSFEDWTETLLLEARKQCKDKSLAFDVSGDLGDCLLITDRLKLTSVTRHLLGNAIKYTPSGIVQFLVKPDFERQRLSVTVIDSGPGLSRDFMQNIFQPFRQAESGFKRKHQGVGIGLAMSRAIVASLKGRLKIRNRDGEHGLIAEFSLPVKFQAKPDSTNNDTKSVVVDMPLKSPDQSQSNILVVEDNKINQIILKKLVQKLNCNVILAENGQEAIQQLKAHHIDLVLMDCQMPVMDGFEATEAIRKLPHPKNKVPIVAVTANARDADKARCMAVGMNGFVGKPIDLEVVKGILEKYLPACEMCSAV